jgi:hypothetical protein
MPAAPDGPLGPIPLAITAISISVTIDEIALLLGQNRTILDNANMPSGFQKVEWSAAYSLSPSTAVNLHAAIGKAIEQFSTAFGKIPVDPNTKPVETGTLAQ